MQTIHTIGTQGHHDDDFITVLRAHQIDAVIDIRLNNEGQYYKFASGRHLKTLVEANGIAYRHDLRFAPTREIRDLAKAKDWVAYESAYLLLIRERDMARLWQDITVTFQRPCLLCAEKTSDHCHRRLLGEALVRDNAAAGLEHL